MAVASLAYVVFETTDADGWDRFLTATVGLARTEREGPGHYYAMDDGAWRMHVRPGSCEGLAAVGLEFATRRELDACLSRAGAAGCPGQEDSQLARQRQVSALYRLTDPCGNPVELVLGRTLGYEHFVSPAGVTGFVTGHLGDMGLGHVVLPAPAIEQARTFWMDVIGLGLTDTMTFTLSEEIGPQTLYFMHANNARHHSVALFEAPSPSGIIHVMVEANTIDDLGRFIDRCERDGVHIASQFGRHSNDRMLSVYVVTPGAFMLEFGTDGMQIDWRNWIPTTSLVPDLWGHKFMGGPPEVPAI